MEYWFHGNTEIIQQLVYETENGNISERPSSFSYTINSNISPSSAKVWQMLSDYIHLTNNRLGIHNKDESFLAFMIKRSLEEVLKKKEVGRRSKN